MTGIQLLTDEHGHKLPQLSTSSKHRALWEDIQDVLVSCSRSREKGMPLAKVKTSLIARGKLRG